MVSLWLFQGWASSLGTNKQAPTTDMHQEDYPPWPSSLYPRDAGIIQHIHANNCNKLFRLKDKNCTVISIDAEKASEKSNILYDKSLRESRPGENLAQHNEEYI